jgi:hypothetical protein
MKDTLSFIKQRCERRLSDWKESHSQLSELDITVYDSFLNNIKRQSIEYPGKDSLEYGRLGWNTFKRGADNAIQSEL